MVNRLGSWMVGGAMLVVASAASATDPSIKCEADKLRLAAKYTACRLSEAANAARSFALPNYDSCVNSYLAGWSKAESRARAKGAPCWTEGDAEVVQGDIDSHTDSLAESLSGGK